MKSIEVLLSYASTATVVGLVQLCEEICEEIAKSKSEVNADRWRRVSRVLDSIGELRFEDWNNLSPARKADAQEMLQLVKGATKS